MSDKPLLTDQHIRKRKGKRGRFPIQPKIGNHIFIKAMLPEPRRPGREVIYIDRAEIEAMRLVDLEGMYQEQAGISMGVSRGTVWRLLMSAREKVTRSIVEGRRLLIGEEP